MAIGDAAQAAGMDVVLSSDDRRAGYQEINRTRDYIAAERRKAVRNVSEESHVIGIYWDPARAHLVARVDITDIGHLALTEDVRLTNANLQAQLTEVFSRLYALEQRAGIAATNTTTAEGGTGHA
ncbi:hypothetical protein SAMN04487848_2048 [Microbacterium sp. ru370.1]|uniref:hypothetical protein n=1 Tax=unclassified Microbacterium TaxID=2609290 RepID=UPI00088EBDB7|nr:MULTISPECIES: hypothetical protein [unclassified Microbacterium]SDO77526.1 hypothetical protein SAMN04487848_2048 [Microbacterium sp. ru370.1]SIT88884.1 hypothetical protein SAMN05880579_2043 [Microbacterium sp. RU1D]